MEHAIDLDAFRSSLAAAGIDVVQPFDTRWYNDYISKEGLPLKPLPVFGRESGAVGLLLGNSKALWPAFLAWLAAKPDAAAVAEPLDTFVVEAIEQAAATLRERRDVTQIFWPWEGGERLVSMQRVAVCSALCYHDSETQLAVHPIFGAWIAFRAVVVIDAAPTTLNLPASPPKRLGCLMGEAEKTSAKAAMAAALRASDEANLCTQLHGQKGMETDVRLAWATLRDCVHVGKEFRYSDDQLLYHYTKDRAVLLRAMAGRVEPPRQRSRRSWLASLAEVLLTFALPSGIALLAIYALGMPGKPRKVTRVAAGR